MFIVGLQHLIIFIIDEFANCFHDKLFSVKCHKNVENADHWHKWQV